MASVAFVTTEHDEADPSPAKLPRAPVHSLGGISRVPHVGRDPGAIFDAACDAADGEAD